MTEVFADRGEAGARLASVIRDLPVSNPVVLAIPRGGLPVASEIAHGLAAPLTVAVARKVGAPNEPEYGIGAVAEGGVILYEPAAATACGVDQAEFSRLADRELTEVRRQVDTYRGGHGLPDLTGRTAILVDDGVATGITDRAALRSVRACSPEWLVLAVPVCPVSALSGLEGEADELVCLQLAERMSGVSQWYRDFSQVSDREVMRRLGATGRY